MIIWGYLNQTGLTRMYWKIKTETDLFVSVHADAFRDRRVSGSSVYILSRNGASSEAARWIAEQENAADLVGGVSLDDKDELLASVLLDLSQTATISASTSTVAPSSTSAVFNTAPTPVCTAQPMTHAMSRGMSFGILIAA